MARDSKVVAAAINIRISEDQNRDYAALIALLAGLRRGVRVHGESYLAINYFDPETNLGILSKYTEIDIQGDWFDLDDFDTATPDKIDEINIPDNLRPNLSQFYLELNPGLHILAFSSYISSKGLSPRSVQRYFSEALDWPEVIAAFGRVESDIVQSYAAVDAILDLPELKELHLVIRRPNSDDLGSGLAAIIEERLSEQNADEYEESLVARGAHSIQPNERTRKLAQVAAENGKVVAKSVVSGVLTPHETIEVPLTEQTTYKSEGAEIAIFQGLTKAIFGKIAAVRAALQ